MTGQRWWILAGLAGVAALAWVIAGPSGRIKVETEVVTRGPISVTVEEEGRTRLRDLYLVASPVAGRVGRITAREGKQVIKDDLLARIYANPADPREAGISRAQLEAAEARRLDVSAQVEKALLVSEQAEKELRRALHLFSAGAVSQEEVERARLAATSAGRDLAGGRASLRTADAEVQAARASLVSINPAGLAGPTVDVRAPIAGRVLRVLEQSSRVVQAGTPLIELGDVTGIEGVIDVLSEDAVRIQPGNPVTIDQWGGETDLTGQVRMVEPRAFTRVSALGVEEQRVHVLVDLVDPPPSLGVGYRLEARIAVWSAENALRVPTSALFQHNGGWAAFAVRDGRAERRKLSIGQQSAEITEVREGLGEGDRVILYPSALVDDGVRVR